MKFYWLSEFMCGILLIASTRAQNIEFSSNESTDRSALKHESSFSVWWIIGIVFCGILLIIVGYLIHKIKNHREYMVQRSQRPTPV